MNRRATRGQPFRPSADQWNRFEKAADAHQQSLLTADGVIVDGRNRNPGLIKIKATGRAFARDEVAQISTPAVAPTTNEPGWRANLPAFSGVAISNESHGRIAVMLEPAAENHFGLAMAAGLVRCRILVVTEGDHAKPTIGAAYLHATPDPSSPCEILWQGTPDVNHLAYALLRICNRRSDRRAEICLSENHPGAGIKFNAKLGHWNAALEKWCYDSAPTVKGIDFRRGVPYPEAGARGMATARPSSIEGTLWELDNLDCISAGACPTCIEE